MPLQKETMHDQDKQVRLYAVLMESVLLVYFRISEAPTAEARKMVYDKWLLDVPKLLDITAIYGPANPEIIRKLIENAIKTTDYYDDDILDFFSLLEKHPLL